MKYDIISAGFPVVEIMRKETEKPFTVVADFIGPYPSGDTCIFIDVAARLGNKCGHFGVVGSDDFGKIVLNRLSKDGVDTSLFRIDPDLPTGVAFVSYYDSGDREFLFLIENSAAGTLSEEDIDSRALTNTRWVHFSGEPICAGGENRNAMLKMLNHIPKECRVSLDPNLRSGIENIHDILKPFIDRADVVLPSEKEAMIMMETETDEDACKLLADQGKVVALKRGKKGCKIYTKDNCINVKPFQVDEVDPTGCGDSFCAGFVTGMLKGWPLEKVGCFANATGALQATEKGPMEGAKFYGDVVQFIKDSKS